jgi:hypothetical protein
LFTDFLANIQGTGRIRTFAHDITQAKDPFDIPVADILDHGFECRYVAMYIRDYRCVIQNELLFSISIEDICYL